MEKAYDENLCLHNRILVLKMAGKQMKGVDKSNRRYKNTLESVAESGEGMDNLHTHAYHDVVQKTRDTTLDSMELTYGLNSMHFLLKIGHLSYTLHFL